MHKLHAQYMPTRADLARWAKCGRHVDRSQMAAFEEGVTCKTCLKALAFDREQEEWRASRQKRQEQTESA